jgi:hypothetical protein
MNMPSLEMRTTLRSGNSQSMRYSHPGSTAGPTPCIQLYCVQARSRSFAHIA